jgi:hypothetical protein
MDNGKRITDDDLRKNLGSTLIQWVKTVKEKRSDRNNYLNNLLVNGGLEDVRYSDLESDKNKDFLNGENGNRFYS